MKIRVAVVAGLTLAGLITGQAGANSKTCNLLQDDKGDAEFVGGEGSDSNLDILSADVASNAKDLTGVLRLASVTDLNPRAPGGQFFVVVWTVANNVNKLYLSASVLPGQAPVFAYGELVAGPATSSYTSLGTATGVLDKATGQVRITAPLSGFAGKGDVKPGSTFKDLMAETRVRFGVLVSTVDDAVGKRSYTAGNPSCVDVGK